MNQILVRLPVVAAAFLLSANAHAIRTLQLDILGGSYNTGTQTIIGGSTGTLFAYGCLTGNCDGALDLSQTYYIAAAVLPNDGITDMTDFGSFSFGGVTYDASNTVFGAPPLESGFETQLFEAGDLAKHDVYDTVFAEIAFEFDSLVDGVADATRSSVDTQFNPGTDPLANPGGNLAFVGFDYDATGLLDGFYLHFDLYAAALKTCLSENGGCITGDVDITDFAAFSHDAETSLPEPGSSGFLLIGLAGAVVAHLRRRRPRQASL